MIRLRRQWCRKLKVLALGGGWQAVELRPLTDQDLPSWELQPPLQPGWYRIAITLRGGQHRYLLALQRAGEPFNQYLMGTNALERGRLIRVRRVGEVLRLQLLNLEGELPEITLRLRPHFTPHGRYLKTRMLRRRHGLYRPWLGGNPRSSAALRWRHYNNLFALAGRRIAGYGQWIRRVEQRRWRQERLLLPLAPVQSAASQASVSLGLWPPRRHGTSDVGWQQRQWPGPWPWTSPEAADWMLVLPEGDQLAAPALRRWAECLAANPAAELIYADADCIDGQSRRSQPHFKPAWNPDLLLSDPHYSRAYWVRADRFRLALAWLRQHGEEPTDYGLLLALSGLCAAEQIWHLPEVLVHHQGEPPPRGTPVSAALVERLLARQGQPGVRVKLRAGGGHALQWPLPAEAPLVSLIIPTRDRLELLRGCIDSIQAHPEPGVRRELIVVDNGSQEPETLAYLEALQRQGTAQVLRQQGPFNYSALNNEAVAVARGEVLALLNNDVEVLHAGWLETLTAQALRPEIGCVGARLLYPDGTLQHGGVILGIGGVGGHAHKYGAGDEAGFQLRAQLSQNLSAVTGAVLFIRRRVYQLLGGLDAERLQVSYNDLDLCLKAMAAGYRNLWCAEATLVHHESKSRGAPRPGTAAWQQWQQERQVMQERWGWMLAADPHYSPHLSLEEENFSLRLDGPLPAPRRVACWLEAA